MIVTSLKILVWRNLGIYRKLSRIQVMNPLDAMAQVHVFKVYIRFTSMYTRKVDDVVHCACVCIIFKLFEFTC